MTQPVAQDAPYRELLARLLAWEDAHVGYDAAIAGIPPALRGELAQGFPHTAWQLIEHLRITQHDILNFCRNRNYEELEWPNDYWPASAEPPSDGAWNESAAAFRRDREALQKLAADTTIDLTARIPHGSGQTYARELVLVADHTSYHIGQLVLLRRALGNWNK